MKIEISEENRETIRKNIITASFQLDVLNQLPVGAHATMYFGTNSHLLPSDPSTWVFSREAHIVARTEPNVEQMIPLSLSHDEIMLFANETVYLKMTFLFDASDGPVTLTASPSDYIQIRSMINVQTHIEE